jgi:NAD-dependent deacetylase
MINDDKIKRAARLLEESRFVVAFTGAGISTDSGIPDFRSPKSGMWNMVDQMAVASIYGFKHNPDAFFDWILPLAQLIIDAEPNSAHRALLRLEQLSRLHTIITQNIDTLHSRAGSRCIYELHGHMRQATCTHCFTTYDGIPIIQKVLADRQIPICPNCERGVLKPNVILMGEQLPIREFQGAKDASRKSDLMLIVGSSLEVAPASDLPLFAHRTGAKLVIINLAPTHLDDMAEVVIHERAAIVLPQIAQELENLLP